MFSNYFSANYEKIQFNPPFISYAGTQFAVPLKAAG